MSFKEERRGRSRVQCYLLKLEEGGFLPVWSFLANIENSLPGVVINISHEGVSLLVSKEIVVPSGSCLFTLYMSDGTELTQFSAKPEIRWVDESYSIDNQLLGLKLINTNSDVDDYSRLIEEAAGDDWEYIYCQITPE